MFKLFGKVEPQPTAVLISAKFPPFFVRCRPEQEKYGIDYLFQALTDEYPAIAPFFLVPLPVTDKR